MQTVLGIEALRISGPELLDVGLHDRFHVPAESGASLRNHPEAVAQLLFQMLRVELVTLVLLLEQTRNLASLGSQAQDSVHEHILLLVVGDAACPYSQLLVLVGHHPLFLVLMGRDKELHALGEILLRPVTPATGLCIDKT